VRLEVDQNKARALGVDSQLLGNTLQTLLSGVTVTQYRDRTETIDVVARAVPAERLSVEGLEAINLRTGNGGVVSLPSSRPCASSSRSRSCGGATRSC
jgi:multidrug efflux pump